LKAALKVLLYVCLSAAGLVLLTAVALTLWFRWEYHLPSDQRARQYFEDHRAEFVRFASMLRQDSKPRAINRSGVDDAFGKDARVVPEYTDLMSSIGAQQVFVRPDGSIEFQLWGFGCAPCADSFKGLRFQSVGDHPKNPYGGEPTVVSSLEDENLPKNDSAVADGLYVVPIDGEWSIFRLEISD
jgi:hypothetical protein